MNKTNSIQSFTIHPLFWLVSLLSILNGSFKELMIVFFIVLCHEGGHVWMASRFGWEIQRLSLLPFGGEVQMDGFGRKPIKQEVLVILAGPFLNLVLLLLCICIHFILKSLNLNESTFIQLSYTINMGLLFFNLLPIYPLDGGRLMFTALSVVFPYLKALRVCLSISVAVLMGLIWFVLYFDPLHLLAWMAICFIGLSLWHEKRTSSYHFLRFLMSRSNQIQTDFLKKEKIFAELDQSLFMVFSHFYRTKRHVIVVTDHHDTLNLLDEKECLSRFFSGKNPAFYVRQLLESN
jgi:stage IV sporulation protein FB